MSGPVWLLTSRGRPELAVRTVEACRRTGMRSPLVLYVDGSAKGYDRCFGYVADFRVQLRGGGLAHSLEWLTQTYPRAVCYGWLADDTYPRTDGWDSILEKAAGDWWLSYAYDQWLADDCPAEVAAGSLLTSGLCWGGELVRTVGGLVQPPGVVQAGIDLAWSAIIEPLVAARYQPRVIVEHQNYRTGKRAFDATDEWTRDGDPYVERDLELTRRWLRDGKVGELVDRVLRGMPAEVARLVDEARVREDERVWAQTRREATAW